MEMTESNANGITVVGLQGRLDASTSKLLEEKILAKIRSGTSALLVDLAQLDYISSSGLRVFLLAAKELKATNGRIVLCGMQDSVRQVFEIAGFSTLFSIQASKDEAIKELS